MRSPARSASGSPAPALPGQGRSPGMLLGGMLPAAPGTSPVGANGLGASLAKLVVLLAIFQWQSSRNKLNFSIRKDNIGGGHGMF